MFELFDVPRGVQETEIDYPHIFTDTFNFLQIPQREGIVVAIGKENGIGVAGIQQVVGVFPGDIIAGTVMGMVVGPQHVERNDQQHDRNGGTENQW